MLSYPLYIYQGSFLMLSYPLYIVLSPFHPALTLAGILPHDDGGHGDDVRWSEGRDPPSQGADHRPVLSAPPHAPALLCHGTRAADGTAASDR
jgi:hypothetical protein